MSFWIQRHRSLGRFSSRWMLLLVGWLVCFWHPSHGKALAEQPDEGASADSFQIIVRISQDVFRSPQLKVNETRRIDTTVLGARTVGWSEITGDVFPDFKDAGPTTAFDLVCRGEIHSRTLGRSGAAVIRGQKWTDFELQAPIRIHRETGFTAGALQCDVKIKRECRKILSTAPGFRGHAVRAVTRRRIAKKEMELRQITQAKTRHRLQTAFQSRIDQRLQQVNQGLTWLQTALGQQSWFEKIPQLVLGTDERHLLVGIDFRGRDGFSRPTLPELPTVGDDPSYPLDIFLGPELFENPFEQLVVAAIAMIAAPRLTEEGVGLVDAESHPRLQRLKERLERSSVKVEQAGLWTVIQVRRDP